MKGKLLLLLGIGFVPLALIGQTAPYLYNKGTMSVVTGNNANTALFIGGDLVSEASPTKGTGSILLTRAKVVLTGNLYNYGEKINATTWTQSHVFNVNNYTGYGTEADESYLYFQGTTTQNVWQASAAGGLDIAKMDFELKANSAIHFPNIVIDNDKHVTIHPEVAAKAYNVKPVRGRLILESRKLTDSDKLPTATSIHNKETSSVLAHLLVKGAHTQSFSPAEGGKWALDAYPGVQVNLALSAVETESKRPKGDAIVGMGVPFKEMRADYFMFNFLFMPSGNSIFNADGNTSVDPLLPLKAGQGFVIGIDLRGTNAAAYKDIHYLYYNGDHGYKIAFDKRVNEKYRFNRFAYGMNPNNLFQVSDTYTSTTVSAADKDNRNSLTKNVQPSSSSAGNAYTHEVLNSADVKVDLVKGYNYLSNPFTCPLDVTDLVYTDDGTTAPGWGVAPGHSSGGTISGDIANRVWVLDPASVASGTYNIWSGGTADNPGNKWVVAHYSYNLISKIGSTRPSTYDNGSGVLPDNASQKALIAPLQMFLVYANAKGAGNKITIPASARRIDENALFLRSSGADKYESEPDDFLFEVQDLDTGTKDRAAVVLRTFSEINKKGYRDVMKLTADVSSNEDGKTKSATSEGVVKASAMSALYTMDSDGNAIESKFLAMDMNSPTTTTTLYLQPSLTKHNISIRSFRNYTKDKITEIVLKDNQTNKTIKLSDGAVYTTSSSPKDDPARFKLTFKYSPVGGIGEGGGLNPDETNITAYYKDNTLTVSGFNDSDYGNQVSVYDIQGRLIKQSKVDGTTVEFKDGFNVGAYIVKVTGSRSYATKFLAR